jgi:PAS domain-containing protein
MLMFVTISHDGDRETAVADTVQALVASSGVPLAAVDLTSGQFLAVNPALADALGATVAR